MRSFTHVSLLLLAGASLGFSSAASKTHPRVRMTAARLATLQTLVKSDVEAKGLAAKVDARAESLLSTPTVQYGHTGVEHSLLEVSRTVCDRLYTLGMSYLLTGKKAHAARAVKEMVKVAGFPDWNPTHFLDTAEMTHCVGIGYDWTFDAISTADRATIEAGVAKNGLEVSAPQLFLHHSHPHTALISHRGAAGLPQARLPAE
jgi:hypothetical protein